MNHSFLKAMLLAYLQVVPQILPAQTPLSLKQAIEVYMLAYAEYLKIVNDYNNHVSKFQSVSGVFV